MFSLVINVMEIFLHRTILIRKLVYMARNSNQALWIPKWAWHPGKWRREISVSPVTKLRNQCLSLALTPSLIAVWDWQGTLLSVSFFFLLFCLILVYSFVYLIKYIWILFNYNYIFNKFTDIWHATYYTIQSFDLIFCFVFFWPYPVYYRLHWEITPGGLKRPDWVLEIKTQACHV